MYVSDEDETFQFVIVYSQLLMIAYNYLLTQLLYRGIVPLEYLKLIEAVWRIHVYVPLKWVIIGSDNGVSPVRRQTIIWTNAGILLIGPLGTNFSEILIGIQTFSFKKLHLKMSS